MRSLRAGAALLGGAGRGCASSAGAWPAAPAPRTGIDRCWRCAGCGCRGLVLGNGRCMGPLLERERHQGVPPHGAAASNMGAGKGLEQPGMGVSPLHSPECPEQ